jgi:hypothetical protein
MDGSPRVTSVFFISFIHMCIQCLGHFSPLPFNVTVPLAVSLVASEHFTFLLTLGLSLSSCHSLLGFVFKIDTYNFFKIDTYKEILWRSRLPIQEDQQRTVVADMPECNRPSFTSVSV